MTTADTTDAKKARRALRSGPVTSWPFPPARLTARNPDRSMVLCPSCQSWTEFRRLWCESCGETT